MLNNDLSQQIKRNFPYKPTEEQENAVKSFAEFLFSPSADSVFLMKGYAGTGKTTLTSALVPLKFAKMNGALYSSIKSQ